MRRINPYTLLLDPIKPNDRNNRILTPKIPHQSRKTEMQLDSTDAWRKTVVEFGRLRAETVKTGLEAKELSMDFPRREPPWEGLVYGDGRGVKGRGGETYVYDDYVFKCRHLGYNIWKVNWKNSLALEKQMLLEKEDGAMK